ncbi:MBL fold metallo-hydrolase [uncultured Clostridium sp.]|uniref:ComEC/Rec2 family competence protein n=1 Tax=uncultured Clostridium sp. TaxID=59620 RepID=UPI0025D476FC|nr:MBL fold metallo-hydrolase [uncultured Clostridium sp.]
MKDNKLKKFICMIITILGISFVTSGCSTDEAKKINNENYSEDSIVNEVESIENAPFKVTYMNVGKADCILITIDDKSIMIDAGLNSTKKDVISELKERKIDELDYLILTHMDKDHIGGADAILKNIKINNLVQADYVKDSKQYEQYAKSVKENNIEPVLLHGSINTVINGAEINIYSAEKNTYSQSNDYSIIVGITYGNYSFLFAGDAEEERLAEFIKMNDKRYDVVKIPHHGRINAFSEEFIKSINPSYSIITCSDEDRADDEMLDMLEKYKVKVLLTSDGEVTIETDGSDISIYQKHDKR